MLILISFFTTSFFLLGIFFLTALTSAFRKIHNSDSRKRIVTNTKCYFYRPFHLYFFPEHEYEGLFFATICAQNITRCCYAASAIVFLLATPLFDLTDPQFHYDFLNVFWIVITGFTFLIFSFLFGEYLPRILGMHLPEKAIFLSAPFASFFMFLVFPITYLFLRVARSLSQTIYFDHLNNSDALAKQEIIDIIHEAELSSHINRHDKKLIASVLAFRDRIVREVMVPRVDVFSLPENISIQEAVQMIATEGYSRIPIYRNTVDEIVGVIMYKDILSKYREYVEKGNDATILNAPIDTLQKSVLYTPETKTISNLLQEFRKEQVHLAIVVDEYGGTEGIVTIEDILEEIVGDISDEYDTEETHYKKQPDGSWLVDARMNILDAEELLGINIPQEGDYETIGGYIFDCAGTIPSKGYTIHRDDFELEVLDSNERVVEQVRITPRL